jgi:hypothetical protein
VSSELKSADLEVEDLSKEILACEKKVYETFLGPNKVPVPSEHKSSTTNVP